LHCLFSLPFIVFLYTYSKHHQPSDRGFSPKSTQSLTLRFTESDVHSKVE